MTKPQTASKAIAPVAKKEGIWAAAQFFMGPATPQKTREQSTIKAVSRLVNVSPFGINILGSTPYFNKTGLEQKLKDYYPTARIKYEWVQIAKNDDDKAICMAKVTDGKGDLTDWVLGECSTQTMSMKTLKGYQNHMAQTRAKNRAINELIGERIHAELINNFALAYEKSKTPAEKKELSQAVSSGIGTASMEEMVVDHQPAKKAPAPAVVKEEKPMAECHECAAPIDLQVRDFSKKIHGRPLCRVCQTASKPLSKTSNGR